MQRWGRAKDNLVKQVAYSVSMTNMQNHPTNSSSGGNAGHAVAVAGKKLSIPVEAYVPITTPVMMIEKLQAANASVIIEGRNWNEADAKAKEALAREQSSVYIPPFDDPLIWEGNSSIIAELAEDLQQAPDAIILSVGGGGLLRGVQLGLERRGWSNTKIIAVETEGAASFAAAKQAGKLVKLDKIDTVATTLGALQVTESVLHSPVTTVSVVATDRDAVSACLRFAEQQRVLVEPSCGVSLSMIYNKEFHDKYLENCNSVVVIVCGGSAVSLDLLGQWKNRFEL